MGTTLKLYVPDEFIRYVEMLKEYGVNISSEFREFLMDRFAENNIEMQLLRHKAIRVRLLSIIHHVNRTNLALKRIYDTTQRAIVCKNEEIILELMAKKSHSEIEKKLIEQQIKGLQKFVVTGQLEVKDNERRKSEYKRNAGKTDRRVSKSRRKKTRSAGPVADSCHEGGSQHVKVFNE